MTTVATSRPPRQRQTKPLPPVAGTCRWLEHIGSDPDFPRVGVVEINDRRYCIGRHDTHFLLIACEPDKQGKYGRYSIPRDLSTCECGDFTFRADRRAAEAVVRGEEPDGRCKHLKALAKLLASIAVTDAA